MSLRMLSLIPSLAAAASAAIDSDHFKVVPSDRFSPQLLLFAFSFFLQAGLLGCEAVLSSMALMQASSMAAPPKKMMTPLGHGPPQREGPDRGPQSHMILPSGMSCPPLVRIHWKWNWGCCVYFLPCKI